MRYSEIHDLELDCSLYMLFLSGLPQPKWIQIDQNRSVKDIHFKDNIMNDLLNTWVTEKIFPLILYYVYFGCLEINITIFTMYKSTELYGKPK